MDNGILKDSSLIAGDIIHCDPRYLPEIVIISKEEADKVAKELNPNPRQFIVSWGK